VGARKSCGAGWAMLEFFVFFLCFNTGELPESLL
jgi:hypothetical protein